MSDFSDRADIKNEIRWVKQAACKDSGRAIYDSYVVSIGSCGVVYVATSDGHRIHRIEIPHIAVIDAPGSSWVLRETELDAMIKEDPCCIGDWLRKRCIPEDRDGNHIFDFIDKGHQGPVAFSTNAHANVIRKAVDDATPRIHGADVRFRAIRFRVSETVGASLSSIIKLERLGQSVWSEDFLALGHGVNVPDASTWHEIHVSCDYLSDALGTAKHPVDFSFSDPHSPLKLSIGTRRAYIAAIRA